MLLLYKLGAAAAAVAIAFGGGAWLGWSQHATRTEAAAARQAIELARRQGELYNEMSRLSNAAQASAKRAAEMEKRYAAALRAGDLRVSVPITRVLPASPGASGASAEARAELAPETAARIAAVGADGNHAVRLLNECIDLYNTARKKINGG